MSILGEVQSVLSKVEIFNKVGTDKVLHFSISFILTWVLLLLGCGIFSAIGITFLVGVLKEGYDEWDYGGFSGLDLVADATGCLLAGGVYLLIV